MSELWEWIRQNRETITIVCTILGGIAATIAIFSHLSNTRARLKRSKPELPKETEPLLPEWPAGLLARSVAIQTLRGGFSVAPRSRVVVIDRGVRQFSRDPGTCSAADAKRLFESYGIGPRAQGLQYITVPVEMDITIAGCKSLDGYSDIEARIWVQVTVDDATAEHLMEWPLGTGRVEAEEARKTVAAAIEPWLKAQVALVPFDRLSEAFQNLHTEGEQVWQAEMASHGVTVAILSFQFSSAQNESRRQSLQSSLSDFRSSLEKDLQERRRGSGR